MIRVFIAEDHKIVRDGIRHMFEKEENFTLVGEAENGKEAIEKIKGLEVDVMIVDINMPEMNGIELAKHVTENYPDTKVLVLSMLDNENYIKQAVAAGATGYVSKTNGKEELLTAIRTVAAGEFFISHKLSLNMIKGNRTISFVTEDGKRLDLEFSSREVEILNLIAEGYTNEEIADKTFTSKRTIETHRRNMIEKTKTRNTASLIKFAIAAGIIKVH